MNTERPNADMSSPEDWDRLLDEIERRRERRQLDEAKLRSMMPHAACDETPQREASNGDGPDEITAAKELKEFPDAPGPWNRNGEWWWWDYSNSYGNKILWGWKTGDNDPGTPIDECPRGNWLQAQPSDERGRLDAGELGRQFDCLRKEYNAITRLSKQFDEFNRVYDPECELPQLAGHVHGIIGELCDQLRSAKDAERERDEARLRLLSAAGDDLCRLSQEEIKELSSGGVKIPPKEEFLASCERFHQQIASGPGVLSNCLTLAQLIAENEQLRQRLAAFEANAQALAQKWRGIAGIGSIFRCDCAADLEALFTTSQQRTVEQ